MAGILLIYILGIYFLLTKMVQLEDEAVVGVKKTHKELSENTHSSNEKAIQYVASNMIKEAPKIAITFDDGPSPAWTPKLLDGAPRIRPLPLQRPLRQGVPCRPPPWGWDRAGR